MIGSDGLWDNIHDRDILNFVQENLGVEATVEKLASTTFRNSLSKNFSSPFYEKAKKANLYYPPMGKSDDITVTIAKVVASDK